jgi:brefeldin A-inhibited guanine nucleotide-exchange protein
MLNTDLHNPQVKKRMTKPEFIRNNRGINDNADLPDAFLEEIYDVILNDEIILKEEHEQAKEDKAQVKGKPETKSSNERRGSKFYTMSSNEIADKTEVRL